MKKITNNTSLVALVLGAVMILYSLAFLSLRGTAIVIGIFGLVFGIAYVLDFVFTILNVANDTLDLVKECILVAAFPLFGFVYYLCMLIAAADALTVTNWIILILILIASLASAALGIFFLVGKNEKVKKIANLAIISFIGLLIILLVFPIGGIAAVLGEISLVDVIFIICYFLVAKPFMELAGSKEKEEKPKEEKVEEAEEPKEAEEPEPEEELVEIKEDDNSNSEEVSA